MILVLVAREDGALRVVAPRREVLANSRALRKVPRVERADRVDRRERLVGEDVGGRRAVADDLLGVEVVLEPDAVEVLAVAEHLLALAVRGLQLGVDPVDVLRPRVQAQVDHAAAEVLAEVLVLVLALLPARGDGGDATGDAELVHRLAQGRVEALRPKEDDGTRRHRVASGR